MEVREWTLGPRRPRERVFRPVGRETTRVEMYDL